MNENFARILTLENLNKDSYLHGAKDRFNHH